MNIWKRVRGIVASAVLMTSAVTGFSQASARDTGGPALWKVADADTTIYLFGTMHTLPDKADWRTEQVAAAISSSDTLVLEILMNNPLGAMQVATSLGMSPNLPPLVERVPPEKRAAYGRLLATSGLPGPFLDRLETWAAAVALAEVSFSQSGFVAENGVEEQLTGLYKKTNKPILGLETVEQQLGLLDRLPETTQRAMLASSIDDPAKVKAELQTMLNAWLGGDVDAIAATFDAETKDSPELRQVLLVKRNQAWSQWIATRLGRPGTVFMAVGAGHLAGPDSVQDMLRKRGIKAERLN